MTPDINFRSADFSVGGGGSLVYRTGSIRSRLTWLDRTGTERSVIGDPDDYVEADLSPDGSRIAVEIRPSRDDIRQSFSTTDGQRFLVRNPDESSPPSITWVMNWPALVAAAR